MSQAPQRRRDWAWASVGAIVALMVTAAGALVAYSSAAGEHARLEEDRAIAMARALAYVAARRPAGEVNDYLGSLAEQLGSDLSEGYFLGTGEVDMFGLSTGNLYLAHLEAALLGADVMQLARAEDRHKAVFDRTEEVLGSAEPFVERLGGVPAEGLAGAAQYFEIQHGEGSDGRPNTNVNVPVVSAGGQLEGVVGITVGELSPSPQPPWALIVIIGLVATLAFFVVGTRGEALKPLPYILGGAMLGLMLLFGIWLQGWEQVVYVDQVGSYATEANGWLAAAAERTDERVDDYALRNYRDTRVTDLGTAPFEASAAVRDRGAPMAFFLTFLLLGAALVGLHGFMVRTIRHLGKNPWAYVYVLPSMLGMVVLVFGPFLFGVVLSFHERDAGRFVPVGLGHFADILSGKRSSEVTFYWTLFVTFLWTFLNVIIHVVVGLSLALILNDKLLKFKGFYRVILILPWAIPNYITALMWRGMFDTNDGAVNRLLNAIGMEGVDWLGGSFATAFFANLVTNSWLGFPFMMVVSLGALQSIPGELYEAADVDGATRWQQFRTITLPLLKPALFPAIVLGSIWTFNMFNIIYLVSQGGPNHSTEILITEAYHAFYVLGRWGYAAAYSVMIFVILLAFSSMLNRVSRATEGAFE